METFEEELEKHCPYCGRKDMREIIGYYLGDDDDYIKKEFKCPKCGRTVWYSRRRSVYKPLEELKSERLKIVLNLNALYSKYCDLDMTMAPIKELKAVKERIKELNKELDKLDKKINKVRRERKENE